MSTCVCLVEKKKLDIMDSKTGRITDVRVLSDNRPERHVPGLILKLICTPRFFKRAVDARVKNARSQRGFISRGAIQTRIEGATRKPGMQNPLW